MKTTLVLVMLLAVTAPAVAQRGGPGRGMGPGMIAAGPGLMARNPAAVVLEHREALDLTASQVTRLEEIRERVARENEPRWAQLRGAFGADPQEMTVAEWQARRQRTRDLAPMRAEIRATNHAAGEEIHELLTDAQEAKLLPLMHADRPRGQPRMGRRGGWGPRGGGGAGGIR
ncbi:MAG: hypothetical protein ACOCVZ_06565 [Gemmatimonadota bacterium]